MKLMERHSFIQVNYFIYSFFGIFSHDEHVFEHFISFFLYNWWNNSTNFSPRILFISNRNFTFLPFCVRWQRRCTGLESWFWFQSIAAVIWITCKCLSRNFWREDMKLRALQALNWLDTNMKITQKFSSIRRTTCRTLVSGTMTWKM